MDYIASAALTISTSLHVRIIAASYGVPRLSLTNDKVTRYAKEWDSDYPYDINIENAFETIEQIKKLKKKNVIRNDLTGLAWDSLAAIKKLLPSYASSNNGVTLDDMYKNWGVEQNNAAIKLSIEFQRQLLSMASDLGVITKKEQKARSEAEYYKKLLKELLASNSWRLTAAFRFISELLKGRK